MKSTISSIVVALAAVGAFVVFTQAKPITSITTPYLRIQTALTQDKTDGVKADAATIAAEAAKLGDDGKPIATAARELEAAADLKAVRTGFGKLSAALLAYGKTHEGSLPSDLRVAFCSMGAGSWLQKGDEIANPYYGSAMLRCGVFQDKK
jgi:hypothetical protein